MKRLLVCLIFLSSAFGVYATDSKLTDLPATTTPAATDDLYIVTDPSGSPTSKKVIVGDLLNSATNFLTVSSAAATYLNNAVQISNTLIDSSSVTKQGNTFNTGSNLLKLSGGLVPNTNVDASSITKGGILTGGTNISVTPGSGITTIAVVGVVSSSFTWSLFPTQAKLPDTGAPAISNSTNAICASVLLDSSTTESVTWSTVLNPYNGGTLNAAVYWTEVTGSTGTVNFNVYVMCVSSGDAANFDTASFGSANASSPTVPGTSGFLTETVIPLTNGDSCAAGDIIIVKLEKAGGTSIGDTAVRPSRIYE